MAQPFVDVLNAKIQYFSPQAYSNDGSSTLSGYHQEVSFMLPMEQENKNVILVGGDYTHLNFQSKGAQTLHSDLYSTSLLLGMDLKMKSPNWRTTFLIIPKINSDFKNVGMDDAQLGGVVMFNYKKKETLKYHFGLYYNREFFGDYFMPLVGIDWNINKNLNLFGDLPNNLNLEYKVSHVVNVGAAFYTVIASYRLSSAPGGMYVREGDKNLGRDEVKLYLNAYINKHLVIYLEGGQNFNPTYTLYNKDNEIQDGPGIYRKSRDGYFINTGLAYRFRLDG